MRFYSVSEEINVPSVTSILRKTRLSGSNDDWASQTKTVAIDIGNLPSLLEIMLAPIHLKGYKTLSIGLLLRESSPLKLTIIFEPIIAPSNNLIPVPEFPKSIKLSGDL